MIESIVTSVTELNEDKVMNLVKYYLSIGDNAEEIIESIQEGMIQVGDLFEVQKYFLGDLIMAGIIFKEVLDMKEMNLSIEQNKNRKIKPTILIGTVKDDLHDIGKNIFSGIAIACGYRIIDLGVDVEPELFLANYYQYKPDIIAISAVLTDSIKNMKLVVDLFNETNLRNEIKIIIGGAPISSDIFDYVGADAFSKNVKDGISICEEWIKNKYEGN